MKKTRCSLARAVAGPSCPAFLAGVLMIATVLSLSSVLKAQCIYFNGAGAHINFGDVLDLGGTFTLEAWTKIETGTTGASPTWDIDVISKVGGAGENNGYELGVDIDGAGKYGIFNSTYGNWAEFYTIGASANTQGVWTHMALTYDNNTLRLYENGSLISSAAIGAHSVVNTASPLMIGGNAGPMNYWRGWIDEVRIWGVARSATEIQNAYLTGLTGTENGLLGYWNFSSGYDGATAFDVTSGGFNGTLAGGASWSTDNAPIPEPSTYAAFCGLASLGFAAWRRRKRPRHA